MPQKKRDRTNSYFEKFEIILEQKEIGSKNFNKILQITKILLKYMISENFEFPYLKPNFYKETRNTFLTSKELNFFKCHDN